MSVTEPVPEAKSRFIRRVDATTWGLLLLVTGVLLVLPKGTVPEGAWLFLAGAILIGASAVRYLNGVGISALIVALGGVALAAGIAQSAGLNFPLFASFLIILGGAIILHPWLTHSEA